MISGIAVWFIPIVLGGVYSPSCSHRPMPYREITQTHHPPADTDLTHQHRPDTVWFAALSIVWPFPSCAMAQQIQGDGRFLPNRRAGTKNAISRHRLFQHCHDPALADPVQSAVRSPICSRCNSPLGKQDIPADISYAPYAHQGAYPLIVTALLAAAFVLAAMKPGGPAERSKVIRPPVYLG